jgi:hypothetical protein
VSAGHPQITFTAFRAISLSLARGTPARARIAMVCSVADTSTASAAGSASFFSSALNEQIATGGLRELPKEVSPLGSQRLAAVEVCVRLVIGIDNQL